MAADGRDIHATTWLRSSRCTPGKNCVELADGRAGMIIRDSKSAATLPPLDSAAWSTFLKHCRAMD